jgi:DhnA family fructose-bisphosphate aldolase class Ia
VVALSDRPVNVLRNLQAIYDHGRLAGTGYVSILPVDQGIEHSAAASFAPNPDYVDPANIVELALARVQASDLGEAVRTAVINKRAGGMGLISGRKAFQRPRQEGAELLHAIQDVYLDPEVNLA